MLRVEWVEEGAMGARGVVARGTLAELLVGGPYPSLSPPEVPPLSVINEMLSSPGGGGMNGGRTWKPFTIDGEEYRELLGELVSAHGFERVEVPDWVTSSGDWHVWLLERRRGVPAERHRQLLGRARELALEFEQARAESLAAPGQLAELFLAAKRAQDDAEHFGDRWLTVPRYSKYRRTMRWLLDARHRGEAAAIAGDEAAARAAAADMTRLHERRVPISDDQWPTKWEDWPEYPAAERPG